MSNTESFQGGHRLQRRLDALELVLDAIARSTLKHLRDVLIQLAGLLPERRHRDGDHRVNLLEIAENLSELPAGLLGRVRRGTHRSTARQCERGSTDVLLSLHSCGMSELAFSADDIHQDAFAARLRHAVAVFGGASALARAIGRSD